MNKERIAQFDGLKVSREEMKNGLFHYNKKVIEDFGSERLKKLVEKYFLEKNLSQSSIEKLQELIYRHSGEKAEKDISILQFLYESLVHKILLPNYNLDNEWKFYQEISDIVDRTINKAIETLNKNDENEFFTMYMPRVGAIRDEMSVYGNVEPRWIYLWNIFETIEIINDFNNGFGIQIPIRIYSSKSDIDEERPSISEKEIKNLLNEKFEKEESDTFLFPTETGEVLIQLKKNPKFINYDRATQEQYMAIEIINDYALDADMTDEKIRSVVDETFECANIIINDLIKKTGASFDKKIFNFSNDYFLDSIEVEAFAGYDDDFESAKKSKKWNSELDQYRVKMENQVKLEDVGGQEKAKKEIETIIKSIKYESIMKSWWAKTTSGIVFEWPSGTGKTLLAKALASEIDAEVFTIKLTDIASDAYINTGSNKVTKLFNAIREKAKNSKKIIIILDEMDALFGNRSDGSSHKEDKKIVNSFLTEMSGFESNDNVIFIGTTNLLENIDPAIIRSGRFSTKIKVDLPDVEAISQILNIHLKKAANKSEKFKKILENFPIDEIVEILKNKKFSGADIEEIVRIIIQEKAMEEIDGKENITLEKSDFEKAIAKIQKTENKKSIGFTSEI